MRRRAHLLTVAWLAAACGQARQDVSPGVAAADGEQTGRELRATVLRTAIDAEATACFVVKQALAREMSDAMPDSGEPVYGPVAPAAWWHALRHGDDPARSRDEARGELLRFARGYGGRVADIRDRIGAAGLDSVCRRDLEACLVDMDERCVDFEAGLTSCGPLPSCRIEESVPSR